MTGAKPLIDVIAKAHQFITFTTPPALQFGIAHALEHEMDFTLGLTRTLQDNRDLLRGTLAEELGFDVLPCEGSYFLTAGIRGLTNEPDCAVLRTAGARSRRGAHSAFRVLQRRQPDHLVRFAFCKKRAVLEEALEPTGAARSMDMRS